MHTLAVGEARAADTATVDPTVHGDCASPSAGWPSHEASHLLLHVVLVLLLLINVPELGLEVLSVYWVTTAHLTGCGGDRLWAETGREGS